MDVGYDGYDITGSSKTRAVIYYEYVCGGKCSAGEIMRMQLIEGRWKLLRTVTRWQS